MNKANLVSPNYYNNRALARIGNAYFKEEKYKEAARLEINVLERINEKDPENKQ